MQIPGRLAESVLAEYFFASSFIYSVGKEVPDLYVKGHGLNRGYHKVHCGCPHTLNSSSALTLENVKYLSKEPSLQTLACILK